MPQLAAQNWKPASWPWPAWPRSARCQGGLARNRKVPRPTPKRPTAGRNTSPRGISRQTWHVRSTTTAPPPLPRPPLRPGRRPVGAFPGELGLAAAEVAAGGRLAIDRPPQVEVLDDAAGREREQLADQLADPLVVDAAGPLRIDVHAHRLGHADGVGQLHLAAIGQAGRDDVLGHVPGHVGGAAIDLRRVLAAERPAAVPAPAAVGIDDDLAARSGRSRRAGRRRRTGPVGLMWYLMSPSTRSVGQARA